MPCSRHCSVWNAFVRVVLFEYCRPDFDVSLLLTVSCRNIRRFDLPRRQSALSIQPYQTWTALAALTGAAGDVRYCEGVMCMGIRRSRDGAGSAASDTWQCETYFLHPSPCMTIAHLCSHSRRMSRAGVSEGGGAARGAEAADRTGGHAAVAGPRAASQRSHLPRGPGTRP